MHQLQVSDKEMINFTHLLSEKTHTWVNHKFNVSGVVIMLATPPG